MVLWVIKQTRTGNDSKAERAKRMIQKEIELQKQCLEHRNSMPKSYNAGEQERKRSCMRKRVHYQERTPLREKANEKERKKECKSYYSANYISALKNIRQLAALLICLVSICTTISYKLLA